MLGMIFQLQRTSQLRVTIRTWKLWGKEIEPEVFLATMSDKTAVGRLTPQKKPNA